MTSEKDVEHCLKKIEDHCDNIDVLISNAGIFDFYPVTEAGSGKLSEIFDVNVFGLANTIKYFLPLLISPQGRLIVISSESYKVPSPFQPYAVSKQALEPLYKAIKLELSVKGIKCVLIRPGAIQTKILDDVIHFSRYPGDSLFEKEFINFIDSIPKYIGKISKPEEVAQLVLKAGTARRPKPVYNINHNLLVSLLSHLPAKFKEFVIRKSLK